MTNIISNDDSDNKEKKELQSMNILVSIDNKYVEQLINLIFSIKMYNKEQLNVYVIHDDLTEESKNKITDEITKAKSDKVEFLYYKNEDIKLPVTIKHTRINTYYRLYAPFMLDKSIEKILYLDCDIICNAEISELYNHDFNDKCIVCCLDKYISTYKDDYANAGVYLIDLNKYRSILTVDMINKVIEDNIEDLEYQDQDVLNMILKDNMLIIDDEFNYQVTSPLEGRNLDYAPLYHYIRKNKPWEETFSEPIKAIPYYRCLYKRGKGKEANEIAEKHFKNKLKDLFERFFDKEKEYSVDIIIPSYNQTDSIRETLDSICKQELNGIKLTVLLIDDCSQEDYLPIVDEYKEKLDLKYYRMDKNSGVAGARQRGIDEGKGDFFTIIDSDDQYFSKYSIQFLYYAMILSKADVVRSIFMEEEHGRFRAKLYRNDNIACHGKLYRKSFIQDNNIRYLELRGNEDTAYNALLESLGAKYYDLDVLIYRWCFNTESFTRKDEMYHEQDKYTFAKGFLWTAQQIEMRKDQIDKPEEKVCILLAKIFYRLNQCWVEETKIQMLLFASKIYMICKRIKNIDVKEVVEKYLQECGYVDHAHISYCMSKVISNVIDSEEYQNMPYSERVEML